MEETSIEIYKQKELTHKVGEHLIIKDIKESSISNKIKVLILASKCFPKINQLKGEVFPEGTLVGEEDLSGREIRQFQIRVHINKAILHSGYGASLDEKDLNELISSVIIDVLTDFSHLTTQEVGIAFKKGCREEYGEYMGVSTRLFYRWLKCYCSDTKIKANKALQEIDKPKTVEPNKEEAERRRKEWLDLIFKQFDEFVQTGEYKIYDLNNMFYEYLKHLGIITLPIKLRKQILKEAETMLRIENDPLKGDRFSRPSLLEFTEKLNNKDESIQYKIISKSKHIHLRRFLSDLRTKKKSLKDIITKETQQN